ncbi:MAG: radical SAM protein [Candidatus Bathyarchaeia archaeon]
MRVCLLNPPFKSFFSKTSRWPETSKSGTFYYPFWLAYATGVLEAEGYDAILIDAPATQASTERVIDVITSYEPELIVAETSTPSLFNDAAVLEKIKRDLPNVKSVLVGPHVSVLAEETLKQFPAIDMIARKEFDYTLVDIAQNVESSNEDYSRVLGITWRDGARIKSNPDRPLIEDLDAIPFVSNVYKRHLDIYRYYYTITLYPMVQIFTGRGCPYRCTFCLWPQTFMGRKLRVRSAKNVVDELEYIQSDLPQVKETFLEDDTFTVNKKRIVDICDEIASRGLDITWSANARADISLEVLMAMKRAGCRLLVIGYEAGNQGILDNIKKGITLERMRKFTKNCKKVGIKLHACYMMGLPGETPETIGDTIRFAKELNTDMAQFQVAIPFPGTEFFSWCKENDYLVTQNPTRWVDEFGVLDSLINYPELPGEYVKAMADWATVNYYLRPGFFVLATRWLLEDPREMKRFLRSATNFLSYLLFKRTS